MDPHSPPSHSVDTTMNDRAPSIRTMNSAFSGSSTSLTTPSLEHNASDHHPISAAVKPISALSTSHNSPTSSPAPSVEALPQDSSSGASASGNAPSGSGSGLRRPSFLAPKQRRSSLAQAAVTASSSHDLTHPAEARPPLGRRFGSPSALDIEPVPDAAAPARSSLNAADRRDSDHAARIASGSSSVPSLRSTQRRPASAQPSRESSEDERGRPSKFSLSAAIRGLSQDVKQRVSSKSRSRADKSRTPSINEPVPPMPNLGGGSRRTASGSAVPLWLRDGDRSHPVEQGIDPPYGRGGAGSRSTSRERTASPARNKEGERSESRGRGRNKGMKVLTGALGLGVDHHEADDDVHNWKEFRKGKLPALRNLIRG